MSLAARYKAVGLSSKAQSKGRSVEKEGPSHVVSEGCSHQRVDVHIILNLLKTKKLKTTIFELMC